MEFCDGHCCRHSRCFTLQGFRWHLTETDDRCEQDFLGSSSGYFWHPVPYKTPVRGEFDVDVSIQSDRPPARSPFKHEDPPGQHRTFLCLHSTIIIPHDYKIHKNNLVADSGLAFQACMPLCAMLKAES